MRKHCKRETRYVSSLIVRVFGAGVLDMLRYDRCVPATEEDAHKLMRLYSGDDRPGDRIVKLIRYAAADTPASDGRWRSFGCRVLDERSPDAVPLTDAEITNLDKVTP